MRLLKRRLILELLLVVGLFGQAQAGLIWSENFDDQDVDTPASGSITESESANRSYATPGRGGSGYCYSSTNPLWYTLLYLSKFSWLASTGGGTNEYYVVRGADSGRPFAATVVMTEPYYVKDKTAAGGTAWQLMTKGVVGSLAAGEWGWGDVDGLGFSTIYVRLDDESDPDDKNDGYLCGTAIDNSNGDCGLDLPYILWNNPTITTGEIYVSFWLRFPNYVNTDTHENVKIYYPHFEDVQSYTHYSLTGNASLFLDFYGGNGMFHHDYLAGVVNAFDGNWHKYEFYSKEGATPITRMWYDGVLQLDCDEASDYADSGNLPANWSFSPTFLYFSIGSFDAEETGNMTRDMDDVEIRDSNPYEEPAIQGISIN